MGQHRRISVYPKNRNVQHTKKALWHFYSLTLFFPRFTRPIRMVREPSPLTLEQLVNTSVLANKTISVHFQFIDVWCSFYIYQFSACLKILKAAQRYGFMVLPKFRGCYNTYLLDLFDSNTHHVHSVQIHPNCIQLNTTVGYAYTQCGHPGEDVRDVPNRDVPYVGPRLRLNENKAIKFLFHRNFLAKTFRTVL